VTPHPTAPPPRRPAAVACGACTKEVQANSNFQVTYDPATSGDGKVCYKLSAERACDDASPCCLDASTALKSVMMELPSEGARLGRDGGRRRRRNAPRPRHGPVKGAFH
jgi:hypothetical protein